MQTPARAMQRMHPLKHEIPKSFPSCQVMMSALIEWHSGTWPHSEGAESWQGTIEPGPSGGMAAGIHKNRPGNLTTMYISWSSRDIVDQSRRVQRGKDHSFCPIHTDGSAWPIHWTVIGQTGTGFTAERLRRAASEATCTQSKIPPNSRPPVCTTFSTVPPCCEGGSLPFFSFAQCR